MWLLIAVLGILIVVGITWLLTELREVRAEVRDLQCMVATVRQVLFGVTGRPENGWLQMSMGSQGLLDRVLGELERVRQALSGPLNLYLKRTEPTRWERRRKGGRS